MAFNEGGIYRYEYKDKPDKESRTPEQDGF